MSQKPLVLVFEPGERVPVSFDLNSQLFKTDAQPLPLSVEVTQRFYLLIDPRRGLRVSLDGRDFDARPKNSFRLGVAVKPSSAYVDVGLAIRPKS